jgi:hypothetical protein
MTFAPPNLSAFSGGPRCAEALKTVASTLSRQALAWHRACGKRHLSMPWKVGVSVAAAAPLCWAVVELSTGARQPGSSAREVTWIPLPPTFPMPDRPWQAAPAAGHHETRTYSRFRSAFENTSQPLFTRLAVIRPDLLPLPLAREQDATEKLAALREAALDPFEDEPLQDAAQGQGPDTTGSISITGLWAPTPSACSPKSNRRQLLPAVINQDGAWAGEVSCTFRQLKQEGNVAVASSTCSNGRRRWTANVRMAVDGDRLTWSSERGSQTYVRCISRVVEGDAAARDRTLIAAYQRAP